MIKKIINKNAMYFSIHDPEFYISIGIHDGKIVAIDWADMLLYRKNAHLGLDTILSTIKKYFRDAIKFL